MSVSLPHFEFGGEIYHTDLGGKVKVAIKCHQASQILELTIYARVHKMQRCCVLDWVIDFQTGTEEGEEEKYPKAIWKRFI